MRRKVDEVFVVMDKDLDGELTKDEFDELGHILTTLVGIDAELVGVAFDLIDSDNSGTLDEKEFTDVLFKMLKPPAAQDVLMIQKLVITTKQELQAEIGELRDGLSSRLSAVTAGLSTMESRLQHSMDQLVKQQFATMLEQVNASLDARLSDPLVALGDRHSLSEKRQQNHAKTLQRQRSRSTGRSQRPEESPRRGLDSLPPVPIRVARFDETTTADSSPRRPGDWDRDDTSFVE
mmetsp:Transcript_14739/g.35728  ORF Transcript_14739/g.35728 Transcript_14739/m.35728 type:complete len:235 (+) Transcript_14739:2-706(+)